MLACEKFNEVSSRQKEAPMGLIVLLVSSLLHGGGVIPGSPLEQTQPAEAATLDDSSGKTNKEATASRRKARPQGDSRDSTHKNVIRGQASWYGPGFHGKKTASGEIFDQGKLTAAHKTIPLGTKAKVTNLQNGNTVEVEINDRGPYIGQREIDVSHAAANALGFVKSGLTLVRIELLPEESGREEAG
jgi:rare lipoprotein A (peptidoglycan hydrolase)